MFVQLHNHTENSLLDGESSIKAMVERVVQLKQPAVAITDHGNMIGGIELLQVCKAHNIKPILGCEFYVMAGEVDKRTGTAKFNKDGAQRFRKYHQTVLAINPTGYKNLVKLNNYAHVTNFAQYAKKAKTSLTFKASITLEKLQECSEGLVVLSGCRAGVIPQAILCNQFEYALELAQWYKDVFGSRFYLEIQDHGYPEDRVVNVALWRIAQQLGIELIATNDSHFTDCYKVERHDALLAIGTNKLLADEDRMRYSGTEYLKSADEMRRLFRDHLPDDVIERAIANTVRVADLVEDYQVLTNKMREPEFPIPKEYDTQDDFLRFLAVTGIHQQFPDGLPDGYQERLETELTVIAEKGFSGYMLIVWDIVRWAREKRIPVGLGRGSVGGSLVAWVIGITGFDPIRYNCLFERFINPERMSYPDIDLDFCVKRRHEVYSYIVAKYGKDFVCGIGTVGKLKAKNAIQDAGRILSIPPWKRDKVSNLIPSARGKTKELKEILVDPTLAPELHALMKEDPEIVPWLNLAEMVEGTARNVGVHAAGVLVSNTPLDEFVPVYSTDEGAVIAQYPKDELEAAGGLKIDVLGVAELTTIRMAQELIYKNHGVWVDVDHLATNDHKTFELFRRGDTGGVFQFESSGMCQILKQMIPNSIEDLAAANALYRPGPLDTGMIEIYLKFKINQAAITYPYPELEPILNYTYSTIVFQEQVMKLCQEVAGYSLGQADLVRRAMGKKDAAKMAKQKQGFIDGAVARGYDPEWVEALWTDLEKYSEYCFNLPHSIGYSLCAYQGAYLKAHYPLEYCAALLTEKSGKKEDLARYFAMATRMGISILPPDINRSNCEFTTEGNAIRFGLGAIAHLGTLASTIPEFRVQNGEYTCIRDLCYWVMPNAKALSALIYAGALDSLHPNRQQLAESLDLFTDWISKENKRRNNTAKAKEPNCDNQLTFFDLSEYYEEKPPAPFPFLVDVEDFSLKQKLAKEKEFLNVYCSAHPLDDLNNLKKIFMTTPSDILPSRKEKEIVSMVVCIVQCKIIFTREKGLPMSFLTLEDEFGQIEAVAFPDFYKVNSSLLLEGKRVVVVGKLQHREGKTQLILESIQEVDSVTFVGVELTLQQANERMKTLELEQVCNYKYRRLHSVPILATIAGVNQIVVFNPKHWVEDPHETMSALEYHGFKTSLFVYELGQLQLAPTEIFEDEDDFMTIDVAAEAA